MHKDARPQGIPSQPSAVTPVDARWQSLVEQYAGLLRATLSRVSPRELDLPMDDIEQEARVKLWRALKSERTLESPASTVFKAAARATIDAVRRARARREEQAASWEVVDPLASPEREAERALVLAKMRDCLGRMKGDRRRAVSLHLQGFTADEIGRLLGWPGPRARHLVGRGLRQVQDALRGAGIELALD